MKEQNNFFDFDSVDALEEKNRASSEDMFLDAESEDSEVLSSKGMAGSKRKMASNIPVRSKEAFEEMIESVYMETQYRPDGTSYDVKVYVMKPEDNPLEHIRPVFVYGGM